MPESEAPRSVRAARRVPRLYARHFHETPAGAPPFHLTDRQREHLGLIASRLDLPARTILYETGGPAFAVFLIEQGMLKTYQDLPSGRRKINAFLVGGDIAGLAEDGRYVSTFQSVTRSIVYRVPLDQFTVMLQGDAAMELEFLRKLTHELREAQRQSIILARRDATGRIAMFFEMLARDVWQKRPGAPIPTPMSRSDIADFVCLSLEAVCRACRELDEEGLLAFDGRRQVRIRNLRKFAELTGGV
jgi:CRP/FNR family transcriptional regulator